MGAATPPARGIPDPARVTTSSTPGVLPGDKDDDESDGPDEDSEFKVVDHAREDADEDCPDAETRDDEEEDDDDEADEDD